MKDEARRANAAGDYRWSAEILHKLVYSHPEDREARQLQADAYEQLGYQAETPAWRSIYLTIAQELRSDTAPEKLAVDTSSGLIQPMSPELLFDTAAVQLKGDEVGDADLVSTSRSAALKP